MDGLKVIPVDKSQLRKLVDDSRKYVEKLNEYTAQSGQIFMGAFEAAENILEKQDATKEEVEDAEQVLAKAIDELKEVDKDDDKDEDKEVPNKDKLGELIQSAKQIDVKLYTEESAENFMSALAKAKEVFADEDATKAEVEDAEQALAKAIDELKLKEVGKEDKEKNAGAVKTGDSSTPILFAVIAVLSAGTIFFVRKKEEKKFTC